MISLNDVRSGPQSLYKGKYQIVFYSRDGEKFIKQFNNVREILQYRNIEVTRTNVNMFNVELYRALRTTNHYTLMLDGKHYYTVWLIDLEDDEEDYYLIDADTNKFIDRHLHFTSDVNKACYFSLSDIYELLQICVDKPFYIIKANSYSAITVK